MSTEMMSMILGYFMEAQVLRICQDPDTGIETGTRLRGVRLLVGGGGISSPLDVDKAH